MSCELMDVVSTESQLMNIRDSPKLLQLAVERKIFALHAIFLVWDTVEI